MKAKRSGALALYGTVATVSLGSPIAFVFVRGLGSNGIGGADLVRQLYSPTLATITLSVTVCLVAAGLGAVLAWITERTDINGRSILRVGLVLPLAIPSFVGALGYIAAVRPNEGIIGSFLSAVSIDVVIPLRGFVPSAATLVLFTYPYVYLLVRARLRSIPQNHEDAATILGATPWRIFTKVTLPQIWPAVSTGALLCFGYCLSEYGAVSLYGYDTLTRVVYNQFITNQGLSAFASGILGALALLVVMGESRWRKAEIPPNTTNHSGDRLRLGRARPLAATLCWSVITLGLIIPVSSFIFWAVRSYELVGLSWSEVIHLSLNTVGLGAGAGIVAMAAMLPVAQVTLHHRGWLAKWFRVSIISYYALPGIVVALGVVFWTLKVPGFGWTYQTLFALIIGYVISFGSLAMGAGEEALSSVPTAMKDSARLLTPSLWKRWRSVHLPLITPGALAGAGLVMLATVKELPATLKLSPPGFSTLATRLFSSANEGFDARAGALGIALMAVSGTLTWALMIRDPANSDSPTVQPKMPEGEPAAQAVMSS